MKIIFQKKEYESLSECYRINNEIIKVSQTTARKRIKSGIPIDDALLKPSKNAGLAIGGQIVEGVIYDSLSAIAKAYNMAEDAVYKKYSRGFRNDDLVPAGKRKKTQSQQLAPKLLTTELVVSGKKQKSAMKACADSGVKYTTYRKRLDRGLNVEQALGIAHFEDMRHRKSKKRGTDQIAVGKKRQKIELSVFGKIYRSYKKLADDFSLPLHLVYQRIKVYGYTPEEAIMTNGKGHKVIVEGKEYKSKSQAAEAYGITLPILLGRLYRGLTIEQALGIEIRDTEYTISYDGQKYRNLEGLAIAKGISIKALRSRLSRGYTLEQAIDAGERVFNKGRFNKTILLREIALAQSEALLYFVKLETKEGTYHKIGITKASLEDRLKGFQFETIATVNEMLIKAFDLEQEILALLEDKRANISSKSLDGYTEVLDLTDDEVDLVALLLREYATERKAVAQ